MTDADGVVSAQIVDAARRCFLRFGYSRVSTEEIARSIGRSKKTLYKHFATKELLLQAVLAMGDGEAERAIASLVAERGGDRLARLRSILTAVAVGLAGTHRVLLADLRICSPELGRQAWDGRRQAVTRLLLPVLREAVAEGVVRADPPPDRFLGLFLACVEGLAVPGETQAADEPFATLVGLLVDGIRGR